MTMPLIVAIEPDRGQAHQLKAVVRSRLRAELVLADTAEAALKALGDRIPDLVLTSAFLSPRDEAALAERLRTLDAAAAHVQTLTIPVLDAPKPAHAARGVLSSLLRDRAHSAAPDGCDPAVFADQCAAYLERAASERAAQPVAHEHLVEQLVAAANPIAPEPEAIAAPPVAAPSAAMVVRSEVEAEPTPQAEPEAEFELDLSSMLDETVVHELSAAIETVTAGEPRSVPGGTRSQRPQIDAESAEVPVSVALPAASSANGKPKARTAAPPIARKPQLPAMKDDWGLFDPAQCGFAALLAKFDEVIQLAPPLPADSASAGPLDVSR